MAGAGYKLFNTGDVLTAAQVNTYLQEQVVMVFADATARTTALSGVLAEGMVSYLKDTNATEVYNGSAWVGIGNSGDITEVTAGTGLTGGGTSGAVTLSLSTPVSATNGGTAQTTYTTGDILYASASNTLSKKAIGSTGQVLTVSGGIPSWETPSSGGGLTLLESLSLSGATTTSSTISSSYKNLLVIVKGVYLAGNGTVYLRMNTDTGNNYSYNQLRLESSSVGLNSGTLTNVIELVDLGNNSTATQNGYGVINIYRYNDTSDVINCDYNFNGYIAGTRRSMIGLGFYDNAAAITSISFTTGSTFSAGTAYIYGVA